MKTALKRLVMLALTVGLWAIPTVANADVGDCGCLPVEVIGGRCFAEDQTSECTLETQSPYAGFSVKRICLRCNSCPATKPWLCSDYLFSPKDDFNHEPVVEACKHDMASRLKISPDDAKLINIEFHEWGDTSLGCPEPGKEYAQKVVSGWIVQLSTKDFQYTYHTNGVCWNESKWECCPPTIVRLCSIAKTGERESRVRIDVFAGEYNWIELRSGDPRHEHLWYPFQVGKDGWGAVWFDAKENEPVALCNVAFDDCVVIDPTMTRSVNLHPDRQKSRP